MTRSRFFCTCCGNSYELPRKKGAQRDRGHLKNLYCPKCRQEKNHVEVREDIYSYTEEDFWLEFNNGNFDRDGQRVKKLSKGRKGVIKNEEN